MVNVSGTHLNAMVQELGGFELDPVSIWLPAAFSRWDGDCRFMVSRSFEEVPIFVADLAWIMWSCS